MRARRVARHGGLDAVRGRRGLVHRVPDPPPGWLGAECGRIDGGCWGCGRHEAGRRRGRIRGRRRGGAPVRPACFLHARACSRLRGCRARRHAGVDCPHAGGVARGRGLPGACRRRRTSARQLPCAVGRGVPHHRAHAPASSARSSDARFYRAGQAQQGGARLVQAARPPAAMEHANGRARARGLWRLPHRGVHLSRGGCLRRPSCHALRPSAPHRGLAGQASLALHVHRAELEEGAAGQQAVRSRPRSRARRPGGRHARFAPQLGSVVPCDRPIARRTVRAGGSGLRVP